MALGLLVDEGRLGWDVPVRHYLPAFQLYDEFATERLTIRDLVTHRAGLPRHDVAWYNAPHDREELVRRLRFLEPNTDIRTTWQYQNLMYMVAGYLIEHITGLSWEAFVQERIFQPLGMSTSNVSIKASQSADDHARPYKMKEDKLTEVPFYSAWAAGPAGAINTSVNDMTKWLQLQLDGGIFNQQRLIAATQLREMHAPQTVVQRPTKYAELPHQSYGLGWFVEPYRGHNLVHHGGNINGFSTMTSLMPHEHVGIVVLSNLNATPAPWIISLGIYDRLLGLDQINWTERFKQDEAVVKQAAQEGKQRGADVRVQDTMPSHSLEQYVGEYEHPGYGILSFTLGDGTLKAQLNDNSFSVTHYHYDTFELYWEQWDLRIKATFSTNARGDIDRVVAPIEHSLSDIVFIRVPDSAMTNRPFLAQFVGDYELLGVPVTITLKSDTTLIAQLPGQPAVELVPRQGTEFLLKNRSAYSIEFIKDVSGVVIAVMITQPTGTFTARKL
jgi:CubicO group peptidase (beta-lactamase class C family)